MYTACAFIFVSIANPGRLLALRMRRQWPPLTTPEILQHLIIDLPEQGHVDVLGLEGIGILHEADCFEPSSDMAHPTSCSSSAFASLRIGVSRPCVNQP